ncbi:hypothetical protein C8R44DRAFT_892635 [Mycena epipterygia]|nr:hypothetical protein C8R44DRAFT_892635 [Mycena epipterygia]
MRARRNTSISGRNERAQVEHATPRVVDEARAGGADTRRRFMRSEFNKDDAQIRSVAERKEKARRVARQDRRVQKCRDSGRGDFCQTPIRTRPPHAGSTAGKTSAKRATLQLEIKQAPLPKIKTREPKNKDQLHPALRREVVCSGYPNDKEFDSKKSQTCETQCTSSCTDHLCARTVQRSAGARPGSAIAHSLSEQHNASAKQWVKSKRKKRMIAEQRTSPLDDLPLPPTHEHRSAAPLPPTYPRASTPFFQLPFPVPTRPPAPGACASAPIGGATAGIASARGWNTELGVGWGTELGVGRGC